jgi:subtilisin family serine protease
MKTKIVGIFFCMLMITTVVLPVTGTINKRDAEESNGIAYPCSAPNDENFSKQWYMHDTGKIFWVKIFLFEKYPIKLPFRDKPGTNIQAPEAWDIETGSPDVVIAIIDSGIDYTHPDFAGKIWNNTDEIPNNGIDDDNNGYIDDVIGWDFAYNDNDPKDELGHGTMCAGVAGAATNNGIGIAGIGWNCKIMPVQVYTKEGSYNPTKVANAIKYATDNGAIVISMSLGSDVSSDVLLDAVNYAHSKGVFLCAAAHNYDSSAKMYPAAYENVTAVAATNQKDKRCTPQDWGAGLGSNYGDWVDIAAPGNLIYTTMPTYHVNGNDYWGYKQNYDYVWGTSISAPMVAGAAALLLSKNPSLTPDEVKALLCSNVDPYNSDQYIGTGRLNVYKALAALTLSMS